MTRRTTALIAALVAGVIAFPVGATNASSAASSNDGGSSGPVPTAPQHVAAADVIEIMDSAGALQSATRIDNALSVEPGAPTTPEAPNDPNEPKAEAPAPEMDAELLRVIQLTNEVRADNGLGPVTHNQSLSDSAQDHSQDQAERNTLTHTGADGSTPGERMERAGYQPRHWAENAAAGFPSAESVMNGWMNSPGHWTNLMHPDVTEIGVGLGFTDDGYPYWTQVFASPSDS